MSIDICYVISNGFSARMVLHSDVIPLLRNKGLSIAVIAPNVEEENLVSFSSQFDIVLEKAPLMNTRWSDFYSWVRLYLFEDFRNHPVLWANHCRSVAKKTRKPWAKLKPHFFMLVNKVATRYSSLRDLFVRIERRLLINQQIALSLRRLKPRLVVSTYPVAALEATVLFEAQRAGIPTVGHLLSWDNISGKGRFAVVPNYYIAWGPIMKAEIREYYKIKPENIIATGVPHFDMHVNGFSAERIRAVLKEVSLDPEKPYLFFGMSSPYYSPYEIEIVERLARSVEADRFGRDMQLLVRPHPQNVSGYMADTTWLPRLDAMASGRVSVDYPALEESTLLWNLQGNDLVKLANLLRGCVISFNSGSTLSIDAIVHDKPVILTVFDAGHQLPWWQSVERVVHYPHLAKMIKLGGVRVVRSFDEMESAIDAYLDNPHLDHYGRNMVRQEEVGCCDGMASNRAAGALAHFLEQSQKQHFFNT